jgi:hypothetical protein
VAVDVKAKVGLTATAPAKLTQRASVMHYDGSAVHIRPTELAYSILLHCNTMYAHETLYNIFSNLL